MTTPADFRPRVVVDARISLTRDRRSHGVDDAERKRAFPYSFADGFERVGSFT